MRFKSLVLSVALFAPLAVAGDGAREASATFRHADGGFQPHAAGNLRVRSGSDFERFSLVVEGVSESAELSILMGDSGALLTEIGRLPAGSSRREFVRTTLEGGHLPLGAAHAGDLAGLGVRIVDGERHAILVGEVPHLAAEEPRPEPAPATPIVTRAQLLRPEGSALRESRGVVVVNRGGHEESLRCEVGRLAPETGYQLYVGEGPDAILVDDFRTNGEGGGGVGREAAIGQPLGDHLPKLSDLYGRHLEIRDAEGHVALYGHVPEAGDEHDAEPVREHAEAHDDASGADVRVLCEIRPDRGHERFRMDMHDLPRERDRHDGIREGDDPARDGDDRGGDDGDRDPREGGDDGAGDAGSDPARDDRPDGEARRARRRPSADVFMDDGSGTLEQVASVRIDRRGNARLRFGTRRGRHLPLGVSTLRALSGRAFEVRVNGVRAVGGNLPNL